MNSFICYNQVDLCDIINAPLKQTQRIQYTCIDASTNYIVLGATSGSIYLFRRLATGGGGGGGGSGSFSLRFLQIIQNMYGPITHVAISPQEKFVSFATQRGTIGVYVIDLAAAYPQIVTDHYEDTAVTCLHWKRTEDQLYFGDQKGQVFLVFVTSFLGRSLKNISIHPILFLDSPIVQISDLDKLLLVSNYSKCILCNTQSEDFRQIGNTPRDGPYGACFLPASAHKTLHSFVDAKVFCARPGSRLWQATTEGFVAKTTQYKIVQPPSPALYPCVTDNSANPQSMPPPSSLDSTTTNNRKPSQMLLRLQPIFGRFIFSYTKNAFYIVDPATSEIILWNNQFHDIDTVRIINSGGTLVIFTNTRQLFTVACRSLDDCFVDLLQQRSLTPCLELLTVHKSYFKDLCRTQGFLAHVLRLRDSVVRSNHSFNDETLRIIFDEFIQLNNVGEISADIPSACAIRKLDNGMYKIDNVFVASTTTTTVAAAKNRNTAEENLTAALRSVSRNLFNKLNIFNDQNCGGTDDHVGGDERLPPPPPPPLVMVYQNIEQHDDEEIVQAPTTVRRRQPQQQQQPSNYRRIQQQSALPPPPHHQREQVQVHQQLTAEEKLLQDLFMIYKSSRIANLNLVERYATIFDRYDCDRLRELLGRLAALMQRNGLTADVAQLHCYEMYFNYLNPIMIWEFDVVARQFVIDGFVRCNETTGDVDPIERCTDCLFPLLLLLAPTTTSYRYEEIGEAIMKYFWSRNEVQRCFELAVRVPWTATLIAKHWLQQQRDAADGQRSKMLRLLFTVGSIELWEKAYEMDWFVVDCWRQAFQMWVRLKGLGTVSAAAATRKAEIFCANCDKNSTVDVGAAVASGRIVETVGAEFYSWRYFLDCLVTKVHGRVAIELVKQNADHIPCDAIPKDFFLKCLLLP